MIEVVGFEHGLLKVRGEDMDGVLSLCRIVCYGE